MTDYEGLHFKCIDRMHCDPEQLINLKINMQKEIYCYHFVKNLVIFYFNITQYLIVNNINIYELIEDNAIEMPDSVSLYNEFNKYDEYFNSLNPDEYQYMETYTTDRLYNLYDNNIKKYNRDMMFIITNKSTYLLELYDDTFNSLIVLEHLLDIPITIDHLFDIIFYYIKQLFKNNKSLYDLAEPIHNTRGIIINNQDISRDHMRSVPLNDSKGNEYNYISTVSLDEKFKQDIIDKSFMDGYSIPVQEDTNCTRHIVQICKDSDVIMSMTVTGNTLEEFKDKKIHFYIYRTISFNIKSIITQQMYRDLSINLHSFAAYIFNTSIIFSNLMQSMTNILTKNNIQIENIPDDKIRELSNLTMCIRRVGQSIIVNDEFKERWLNHKSFTKTIDRSITIYTLTLNGGKNNKSKKNKKKSNKKNKKKSKKKKKIVLI